MADAKKCDRCGKYYQEVEPNAFESLANAISRMVIPQKVLKPIYTIEKMLDLCPSCSKSLKKWLMEVEDDK